MHKNTRWQQESLGPNKISPDLVMSSNSLSVLEISTVGACYHRSSTGCHRYLLQAKFRSKSMSIRPWTRSIHFLSGATTATTIAKIISLWTFFSLFNQRMSLSTSTTTQQYDIYRWRFGFSLWLYCSVNRALMCWTERDGRWGECVFLNFRLNHDHYQRSFAWQIIIYHFFLAMEDIIMTSSTYANSQHAGFLSNF